METISAIFGRARGWLTGAAALLLLAMAATGASAQIVYEPLPKFILRPIPIWKPGPEDFVEISAGNYHTCARKQNGNTYCWGLNNAGQAGMGSSRTCTGQNCVDRPRLVMGSTKQVEAGTDHTCALDVYGTARCWGYSNYGQLGAGVYGDSSTTGPQTVPGRTFTTISAGMFSTCGTTSVGVYCWGKIIGSGGTPHPTQVFSYPYHQSVTVGQQHACALLVIDSWREADCWGYNSYGQVGVDPAAGINVIPAPRASFGNSVSRVATQADFTCADLTNGTVQCIGYNGWGQLGNGTTGASQMWQAQPVGGGMALSGVSTGSSHACALGTNGAAFCWGNGYWGQVGTGSAVYKSPQAVGGGRSYRAIAAGGQHSCAIGTDNKIWCWGSNYYGQLGTMYPGGWVWDPVQTLDPI